MPHAPYLPVRDETSTCRVLPPPNRVLFSLSAGHAPSKPHLVATERAHAMSVKNVTAEALSLVNSEHPTAQVAVTQGELNVFTGLEADYSEVLFLHNDRIVTVRVQVVEITAPNVVCKSSAVASLERARYQIKVSRTLSVGGFDSLVESTVAVPGEDSVLVRSVVRDMFSALLGG